VDGTVRLWSADGKALATMRGHEHHVSSLLFAPDGSTLASGGVDGTARLWTAAGREICLLSPKGYEGSAEFGDWSAPDLEKGVGHWFTSPGDTDVLAFSPDGRRLLTIDPDRECRVALVRAEDLLALADRRVHREMTEAERVRYAALLGE
jgi:WD40 repeat protein